MVFHIKDHEEKNSYTDIPYEAFFALAIIFALSCLGTLTMPIYHHIGSFKFRVFSKQEKRTKNPGILMI